MNLMQNNNENEIHIHPISTPDLQAAIKKLDEVDSLPLLPAVIHNILPCDIDNYKSGTLNSIDGNNDEILSVNIHPNFMNNRNINNENINDNFSSNTTSNDDNDYKSCEIGNINVENELDFNSSNNDYEKFKEQIVFNPQKHTKRMTPALLRFFKGNWRTNENFRRTSHFISFMFYSSRYSIFSFFHSNHFSSNGN